MNMLPSDVLFKFTIRQPFMPRGNTCQIADKWPLQSSLTGQYDIVTLNV